MKKKQKKSKQARALSVSEMLKLAEEQSQRGQTEQSLALLLRAEIEVQRRPSSGGKNALAAAHPAGDNLLVAQLLARAFFARALTIADPGKRIADLREAVKRASSEIDYLLALGACHLLNGETAQGFEHFQQAYAVSPGHQLVERAVILGQLSIGHTREVKDLMKRRPEEKHDARLARLAIIRDLIVGNFTQATAQVERMKVAAGGDAGTKLETHLINGLALLASGDVARAGEQLDALPALDGNPSRTEAAALATQLFYRAVLHFQAARFKEAAASFIEVERLLQAHALHLPFAERLVAYYHKIAEGVLSDGDLTTAVKCWQHIIALHPNDKAAEANLESARQVQANQEWQRGHTEQALKLWQESLKSRPRDERLLKNSAIACEKLERQAEAVGYWRQLAQLWRQQAKNRADDESFKPRLLRLEQHLVDMMMSIGRPNYEVLGEFESALKIDPANHELRLKYAELFLEIGRPQQALKQFELIERQQGESAELLVHKGMALDMTHKRAAARKTFARAIEIEPANEMARRIYLLVLGRDAAEAAQKNQMERAIEICQQQLALDPQYGPALGHLASLYFSEERADEAQETLARLIAIDPHSSLTRVVAGSIYLDNGLDREAEAQFNRAIELEPTAECFFKIGAQYLENDETKKALKHFRRAAETASTKLLLEIGHELHDADHKREAEHYVDLALKKDPQHPEAHLAKAILMSPTTQMKEIEHELAEAERLAAGRSEFADILDEVRRLRRMLKEMDELERMINQVDDMPDGIAGVPPELRRLLLKLAKGA
ncbi:MAG: tetratricopeptide repeat protein [Acidobacteriota bacterium]|nr:tetratricopeptide repeat protein [Acidobacteriota bacterium]